MIYKINIKSNNLYAYFYSGEKVDVFNDISILSTIASRSKCKQLNYNGELFRIYSSKEQEKLRYENNKDIIFEIKDTKNAQEFFDENSYKYYYKDGERIYYDKSKILNILKTEKYACIDKQNYVNYFDTFDMYILEDYVVILNSNIQENEIISLNEIKLQKQGGMIVCL